MNIDWKMFPMKLHYFLRFAGTGPLTPFLPVIAEQKGVPLEVVGLIWTVLPFISPVTKTLAGAIADCLRAHRVVFLGGVVLMFSALTGLYWIPDMPTRCSNNTLVRDFAHPQSPVASQDSRTYEEDRMNLSTTLTSRDSALLQDIVDTGTLGVLNGSEDRSNDNDAPGISPVYSLGNDTFSNHSVAAAGTLPCSSSERTHAVNRSAGELAGHYEFWMLFLCLMLQYLGHVTVITMQETVCFQMLGKARHKYGEQRLWGTLGWGLSAVVSGALVDWYSVGSQKDYWPAHVITAVFLLVDLVVVARLKFSVPDKMSPAAVHGALWRPQVLLILVSTVVVGTTCGMLWTFQLLLVKHVALLWHPQFPHLKLLLGLVMGVQCFLAETPFFFLAGRIIKRIGHVHAFFVSLVGFAVRLCVYAAITNPWCFLPADLLHGISFGIAYPSITSYANSVSPKGAAATTQAIFGAAFFGGTGLGGLVGGWLFKIMGGWWAFLSMGVFDGVYALVFLALYTLISRQCPGHVSHDEGNRAACEEADREAVVAEEADFEEVQLVDNLTKASEDTSRTRPQTT
ncbi:major facilitator superfamily domain-containing protein 6-like [Panulirus ornatus]|uniref:major facilitator superfamily domain-containing protein 6-like n=1 Tax=Panulirus ornatus TaxID=150431 RepID=UPI003A863D32